MTLDENIHQLISEEARQRAIVLAVLRKQTNKAEHLQTYHTYKALDPNSGLPKLTIDDPVEDSCVLARACHELLFDFDQAAVIAAGQGDMRAFFAYRELSNSFGCPHTARQEFESYILKKENKENYTHTEKMKIA